MTQQTTSGFSKTPLLLMIATLITSITALRSDLDWMLKIGIVATCCILFFAVGIFEKWRLWIEENEKTERLMQ